MAKLVTSLPALSVLRNIIVIFTVKIIVIIAFVLTAEVMSSPSSLLLLVNYRSLSMVQDVDLSKGQVFFTVMLQNPWDLFFPSLGINL